MEISFHVIISIFSHRRCVTAVKDIFEAISRVRSGLRYRRCGVDKLEENESAMISAIRDRRAMAGLLLGLRTKDKAGREMCTNLYSCRTFDQAYRQGLCRDPYYDRGRAACKDRIAQRSPIQAATTLDVASSGYLAITCVPATLGRWHGVILMYLTHRTNHRVIQLYTLAIFTATNLVLLQCHFLVCITVISRQPSSTAERGCLLDCWSLSEHCLVCAAVISRQSSQTTPSVVASWIGGR
ncbi:hypothetical protein J6590_008955 [Homalodisca vitripennis]|nr:hypothetical protein J6590_008955 [Homalodisca vitripennis]